MEFTRVFNAGTADQEELLTVLELLLNEQPPAVAPAQVRDRFFGIGAIKVASPACISQPFE